MDGTVLFSGLLIMVFALTGGMSFFLYMLMKSHKREVYLARKLFERRGHLEAVRYELEEGSVENAVIVLNDALKRKDRTGSKEDA